MEFLVQKLDYELYQLLFVQKDLETSKNVWQKVVNNTVFLNMAIKVEEKENGASFLAPTIVFLILNNPSIVSKDIYDALVKTIFNNPGLTTGIAVDNEVVDYMSLILRNNDATITDKGKRVIYDRIEANYGLYEQMPLVSYNTLSSNGDVVLNYQNGDFCVSLREDEYNSINNNLHYTIINEPRIKDARDFRYQILSNPSFSDTEKEYVSRLIRTDALMLEQLNASEQPNENIRRVAI